MTTMRHSLKHCDSCRAARPRKTALAPVTQSTLSVIGEPDNILAPFIAAGWDETEIVTAGTSWKTFKSFFGAEYKYSPISALYIYLRPQDAGLQKARDTQLTSAIICACGWRQ